jgi:hypothetical protein
MKFQEALNTYLIENYIEVKKSYKWDFSTKNFPLPYVKKFTNDYQNSIDLREFIHKSIVSSSDKASDLQIWYVRDWGGVKSNRQATLGGYIQASSENLINRSDKGIASWSKMLSVRDPSKYAIYDARVALSLNTISLIHASGSNLFFPQLASRNKKIVTAQTLIQNFAIYKSLKHDGDFYRKYLNYLNIAVSQCGNKFDMQTAEMVLFANAVTLVEQW